MVRKNLVIALALLLLCAAPAKAEMSEAAKRNEKTAYLYAAMSQEAQVSFATGIVVGMRTIFDMKMPGTLPPEAADVHALLNYCYVIGNCRHVTPGAIAITAYKKPSEAHMVLKELEAGAVK